MTDITATTSSSIIAPNLPKQRPLRVALMGAGIFATKAHAPVLRQHDELFDVVGVWSRTVAAARKLANTFSKSCRAYESVDDLLKDDTVDAVIMALPIQVQPQYIQMVLKHGKHLLSEKPIAPTVATGRELLEYYLAQSKSSSSLCYRWSVAENYRHEPGILAMAEVIRSNRIGHPRLVSFIVRTPFAKDNPYLKTTWRKEPDWYGGLFVDAFVHGSALLRTVLGREADTVSARTTSVANHIPCVDTMTAQVTWKQATKNNDDNNYNNNNKRQQQQDDFHGVVSVTFACHSLRYELEVVGSKGTATLSRRLDGQHGWKVVVIAPAKGGDGDTSDDGNKIATTMTTEETKYSFGGIEGEILSFARDVTTDEENNDSPNAASNNSNSPEEALADLKFVEACLDSGKRDGELIEIG